MTTIVVTGIGTTNPLGGDAASTWSALLAGESGISTLEHEWVAQHDLPVTFAGQAKVAAVDVLERQEVKRLDPSAQFALISAREAWADAGSPDVDPNASWWTTPPVSVGCGRCWMAGTRFGKKGPGGCCR